jgi:hypothetical protein
MSDVINCEQCGGPHHPDASWCKAWRREIARAIRAEVTEADRLESLAIERHNAVRVKPA